jgi:hypothetical protein
MKYSDCFKIMRLFWFGLVFFFLSKENLKVATLCKKCVGVSASLESPAAFSGGGIQHSLLAAILMSNSFLKTRERKLQNT